MNAETILSFTMPKFLDKDKLLSKEVLRIIEQNLEKLAEIEENYEEGTRIDNATASKVYNKFKRYVDDNSVRFERKEIRILSSSLAYAPPEKKAIIQSEEELAIALWLIEDNWRDSYLLNLIRTTLNHWRELKEEAFQLLEKIIKKKLETYDGNRKAILAFKNNLRYFSKSGDVRLGSDLILNNKSLLDISEYLSIPKSWLKYSYFSKTIITYYNKLKQEYLKNEIKANLEEVLKHHYVRLTKQVVVSELVVKVEKDFIELKNDITQIAFRVVGDPENRSSWQPDENATSEEKKIIEKARRILNNWISEQFVKVFFEECIDDPDRKEFWLNIAKKYSFSFKIVGDKYTKNRLKKIEHIAQYVDSRFKTILGSDDISAIVIYINDYMLIEFSDIGGAFYAYKEDGEYTPSLDGHMDKTAELKNTKIGSITLDNWGTKKEGRMTHQGDWQERFNRWLKYFVFDKN